MNRFSRAVAVSAALCVFASAQGCSWMFVQPVPPGGSRGVITCTSNRAAPVIDTLFTATNLGSVVYVANQNDGTDKGAPIMLGLSVAGLWLASAVYGYQHTAECEAEQQKYDDDEYEAPRPRRRYRAAPPPRTAPPPAAPTPYEAPPPPPPPAPAAGTPASAPENPGPGPADSAAPPAAPPQPAPPSKPAVPQRADDE